MLLIFDLCDFIVFGESKWVVDDLIICLRIGLNLHELFASEIVIFALTRNR